MDDNPLPWLPEPAWQAVASLGELEEFAKFSSDLVEAGPRFREWFNHITPETEKLPLDWYVYVDLYLVEISKGVRLAKRFHSTIFRSVPDRYTPDIPFLLPLPQGEPRPSTVPENAGGALSST